MSGPVDIVMFGFNDWRQWAAQGFCTRCGAYAKELADSPRVGRLLVVSAASSSTMRFIRRLRRDTSKPPVRRGFGGVVGLEQVAQNVFVLDHTRTLPWEGSVGVSYQLNGAMHDGGLHRRLSQATTALGMRDHVLWIADPLMAKHMGHTGEQLCVFDADDDWSAHPQLRYIRGSIRRGYEMAVARSDVFFTVSEGLAGQFGSRREDVFWQPNGVDVDLFAAENPAPVDVSRLPRPIFGYVGVMQGRLDVEAIELLARSTDGSVVLIGPVLTPRHFDSVSKLPNVHFLGAREHATIPAYMKSFDVCVMPHVSDALTRSMNPLKIYEYMAAGRPAVASGLVGFEDAKGLVDMASDAREFAELAVRAALSSEASQSGDARRQYARSHSWTARVEEMLSIIDRVGMLGRA
jgi:teichuronic acid biosynthesis glycosyltransferase TuaH